MDVTELQGEVLTYVDVSEDQIMFTTESGRIYTLWHQQNCCENVRVEDTVGNFQDLVGKMLIDVKENISEPRSKYGSCTKTVFTFRTNEDTVINTWIGESNGFYSESVDFADITNTYKGKKC